MATSAERLPDVLRRRQIKRCADDVARAANRLRNLVNDEEMDVAWAHDVGVLHGIAGKLRGEAGARG